MADKGFAFAKKPLRMLSLLFACVGIFLSLVMAFLINDALGKTETILLKNVDSVYSILLNARDGVAAVESEISTAEKTITDVNSSIVSLSKGVEETSGAISGLGDSVSGLGVAGLLLGSDLTKQLNGSAEYLLNSSISLKKISDSTTSHQKNINDLKSSLTKIKTDIANQAYAIKSTKKELSNIFGLIKIANIVVFVMFTMMFIVLILNSAAGLL